MTDWSPIHDSVLLRFGALRLHRTQPFAVVGVSNWWCCILSFFCSELGPHVRRTCVLFSVGRSTSHAQNSCISAGFTLKGRNQRSSRLPTPSCQKSGLILVPFLASNNNVDSKTRHFPSGLVFTRRSPKNFGNWTSGTFYRSDYLSDAQPTRFKVTKAQLNNQ